jgi:hypothetical protein
VFIQTVSGIALGLLLGTLVGFSQSPVAATVVGALTGALALFLGFNTKSDGDGHLSSDSRASAGRVCGFGFACTAALLLSLYARTHDAFSIPIQSQIDVLKTAKYSDDEAHSWVAYKNAGILLRISREAIADKDDKRTQTAGSVLFDDPGADPCFVFDPKRIPKVDDRISAMRNSGPRFVGIADSVEKLDQPSKKAIMDGMTRLFCPEGIPQ